MAVADFERLVPEIRVWILVLVQTHSFCCSPVLPALLWALSWEMASSGSRELQRFVLHTTILPCRIPIPVRILLIHQCAVAQLMVFSLFTSLWGVKVIPGVEPDGERQIEIKVHVVEALRDVFMEAHTHQC